MTKKILLLVIAICSLGLFSSCEGPMGPMGPPGDNGLLTTWHVAEFTVKQKDWKLDDRSNTFYYEIPLRELTESVAHDGEVLVAIQLRDTYFPLPETIYDISSGISETMNYYYMPGYVTVKVDASDGFGDTPMNYQPEDCTFKITLLN